MEFSRFNRLAEEAHTEEETKKAKKGKPCPEGFSWDHEKQMCRPNEDDSKSAKSLERQTASGNPGDQGTPDALASFIVWGATGLNGDGYAIEED